MKTGNLRLPMEFEEALGDLLKVKPPPKPAAKVTKKKGKARKKR